MDARPAVALALMAMLSCADDSGSATGDGGSTGDGDESTQGGNVDDGTGASMDAATDDAAADTTGDGETAPPELPYARDIRIPRLTANQGVQVTLVEDGVEIAGDDYNTRVISGRRTLIRGFWSVHADFEPRTLIGRLTIDYDDGSQTNQDYEVMVTGDSGDGGASFQWLLEPDEVVPGMRFRARVLEADPDYDGGVVSDPPPVAPLPGRGSLAVYDVPLQLRVILVPVQHEFEGCTMTPEPTEDDVNVMRQQLEQSNPVQEAFVEVGEPMVYTDPIASVGFSDVLGALEVYREETGPADNVYLYGLLDPCDGFPGGLLGQANGIPGSPTPDLAYQRISTGRWLGSGLPTSETFVHEVGHTQGRRHVRCSGGEAGIDTAYPHAGGRIGVWGFGIYDFILRTPTGARDYMTYCSNEWVSDYAWEQTLGVIETLTGWETSSPPAEQHELLRGNVLPNGHTRWWTVRGDLDAALLPSPHRLDLVIDGATVTVEATTQPHADGVGTTVTARLPAEWTRATALQLQGPEHAQAIVPTAVRRSPAMLSP